MAEIRDITMEQGTSYNPAFIVRNADRSLVDFTGYTARMQVRRSYDDAESILDLTTENGKITLSDQGKIQLDVPPEDTTPIQFNGEGLDAVYDLEVESSAGTVTRIAMGQFRISREVTR